MAEQVYRRGSKFRVAIDIYCWILNFRAKFLGKKAREFPKNALDSGLGMIVIRQEICFPGGGFKYFLISPLLGEMIQFDFRIFFRWGGSTTN